MNIKFVLLSLGLQLLVLSLRCKAKASLACWLERY